MSKSGDTRKGKKRGKYTLHKINPTSFKKGIIPPQKGKGAPIEKDLICTVCGKTWHWKAKTIKREIKGVIYTSYTNVTNPPKTCSPECRYKSTSLKQKKEKVKRICVGCGIEFEIFPSWIKNNRGNDGSYHSRACRYAREIPYTEKQKSQAQMAVFNAIKKGKLVRKPCIICGNEESLAHHYKGYKQENWLVIQWYCKLHHMQEHERLRRTGESLLL